jgi:undecaprenyl-diphosphatase
MGMWPLRTRWRRISTSERSLLLRLAVATAALFGFMRLASEVWEGDTMAFDRHLIQALRTGANPAVPIGPHWLPQAMVDITAFGSTTGMVLLTALVAGYLLSTRRVRAAAFIVAATGSGAILGMLLKLIFSRPRPEAVAQRSHPELPAMASRVRAQ